jgi:hypothetical protein
MSEMEWGCDDGCAASGVDVTRCADASAWQEVDHTTAIKVGKESKTKKKWRNY